MDITVTTTDDTATLTITHVSDYLNNNPSTDSIAVITATIGTFIASVMTAINQVDYAIATETARTVAQAIDDADDLNDSQQPWGIVRSDYVGTMTVHNTKCPAYSELAHRLNATYVSRQHALWTIRTGWPSFTEGDCSACGTDDTRTINQQPEIGDWSAFTRNATPTMARTTIHRASCECEPEGRHFHTEIGVTLAAFSLTIHNESAPGIISTADCCY